MRGPKDPFARKMVYGSFVYGAAMLLMFAVLTVVYLHTRPRCSDRVVAEALSPDKRWTATLMERRCGEEAPFSAHVNLRPAAEDLHHGFFSGIASEGEIFLVDQDAASAAVTLRWNAADTLAIQCPHCATALLRKQDGRWKDVVVKYEMALR